MGAPTGRRAEGIAETAEATPDAKVSGGTVTVPAGSPMLTQIRREKVAEAELPTDDVTAPEAQP